MKQKKNPASKSHSIFSVKYYILFISMEFYKIFATLHTAKRMYRNFYDCGNNNNWRNGMYTIIPKPTDSVNSSDKHIEL